MNIYKNINFIELIIKMESIFECYGDAPSPSKELWSNTNKT